MKVFLLLELLLFLMFIPQILFAQCDGPCPAPIDGGLTFLLGAGVVYGIKKVKEQYKK